MKKLLCKIRKHDWRTIVLRTEGPPRICYRCGKHDWSQKGYEWSDKVIQDRVHGKLWPGHSYDDYWDPESGYVFAKPLEKESKLGE